MMDFISKVVDLNNEAARQIQSGYPVEALILLQGAIRLMKDQEPLPSSRASASMTFSIFVNATDLFPSGEDKRTEMTPGDGVIYVYKRPLRLPMYPKLPATLDELNDFTDMTSAHLIFNLALACQEVGRQSGMDAPIQRAMQLYGFFVETLRQQETKCHGHMAACSNAMLQCIALNNLSFLHYEQCNYGVSHFYMECVSSIIHTTGCFKDALCLRNWELEEFLLNPLYARTPSTAHAA